MSGLTKEQLAVRRTGVGASEIAALAGLSRWASPIQIYESKVLGLAKQESLAMRLGNLLEEPVAQLYRTETGRRHLTRPDTVRSREHVFALATPDRAVHSAPQRKRRTEDWGGVERLLQVKTSTWRLAHLWRDPAEDPTGVPEEYQAQVTWEMGVTGVRLVDLAVLFDRDDFRVYTLPFDPEFFRMLVEVAERFWTDHVLAGVPPAPDASDGYAEYLQRRFPGHDDQLLEVQDEELASAVRSLRELELQLKAMEPRIALEKNRIKAAIGEAGGLLTEFGKLTYRKTKGSTRTDWEKVARRILEFYSSGGLEAALDPADVFRQAVEDFTTPVPGHRRLLKPWSREKGESK